MGSCVSRGSRNQVIECQGKRISLNGNQPAVEKAQAGVPAHHAAALVAAPPGAIPAADEAKDNRASHLAAGDLLDLFHCGRRGASVSGALPPDGVQQKGFADKHTTVCGESTLASMKVGYACKKGLKPESPNQDDFCALCSDRLSIFAVFDGHGPYGHDISNFVRDALPRLLVQEPSFEEEPDEALSAAFTTAHERCTEAESECHFDCSLSGTTATVAMIRDGCLYLGHVGDSRVVLARRPSGASELEAEDLTEDHKPTCEGERRRIQAAGGQVRRLAGDLPFRVFLQGKMYPGLAMTRSIGDTVGVAAGVTSTPDIRSIKVEKDWRFLLLCSDGIWELISSKEAVEMIAKFPASEVQRAVEALALEAWNRWIREEGNVVDDITVVCAWFNEE